MNRRDFLGLGVCLTSVTAGYGLGFLVMDEPEPEPKLKNKICYSVNRLTPIEGDTWIDAGTGRTWYYDGESWLDCME